jgi:hypothetical protein
MSKVVDVSAVIARSSSPNDNCQLHLKTRFQRLKTCFHCHSVFVVHTKTPGKIYMMLSLGISNDMSTEMMCEVMKTMFSEDTRERSDSLKPCSTKKGHLQQFCSKMKFFCRNMA